MTQEDEEKMTGTALTRAEQTLFAIIPQDPKYGRNLIMTAIERIGGVNRLVEWVGEDPKNERDFWTKMATRLVQPEQASESGSYAEAIRRLNEKIVDADCEEISAVDSAPETK